MNKKPKNNKVFEEIFTEILKDKTYDRELKIRSSFEYAFSKINDKNKNSYRTSYIINDVEEDIIEIRRLLNAMFFNLIVDTDNNYFYFTIKDFKNKIVFRSNDMKLPSNVNLSNYDEVVYGNCKYIADFFEKFTVLFKVKYK